MCVNTNQTIGAISALAAALAEGHSADEVALIGVAVIQLGNTLGTIAAQKAFMEARCKNNQSGTTPSLEQQILSTEES